MNSPKDWDLRVDPSVLKELRKMPRRDAAALLESIRLLPTNPFFGDIQKLSGFENVWRRRIGAYRLLYKLDASKRIILVFRVARRTSKTY